MEHGFQSETVVFSLVGDDLMRLWVLERGVPGTHLLKSAGLACYLRRHVAMHLAVAYITTLSFEDGLSSRTRLMSLQL